jgi:hypothetical protein
MVNLVSESSSTSCNACAAGEGLFGRLSSFYGVLWVLRCETGEKIEHRATEVGKIEVAAQRRLGFLEVELGSPACNPGTR